MDAAVGVCCAAPTAAKSAPTTTSATRTSPRFMYAPSSQADLRVSFRCSLMLDKHRYLLLTPGERLAPLAFEHTAGEDSQPPWVQPNRGERVGSRAIPSRNDRRVIPDRLGPIEKKVPHHDPSLFIESPGRPAFCDTGVMGGRPIVQRHVRARV